MSEKSTNQTDSLCLETVQYQAFLEEYERYKYECQAALDCVLTRVNNLKLGMDASKDRNLIDSVTYRIKSAESCAKKLRKNGYELTSENLHAHLRDIAGIRVITLFEDDIFLIAEALRNQSSFIIDREKDYVTTPNKNGYSSYHMTARVEVFFMDRKVVVPVEIQIRDKTMDAWASIEHVLGYKYAGEHQDPNTRRLFEELAKILRRFRATAIRLRDYCIKKYKKAEKG